MGSCKGSAMCTVKYIFLIFNALMWVLGCGLFAVGLWMQLNKDMYVVVLPSHSFLTATSLLITSGAITLVIGFVGCCGTLIENKCMLVVYFVFVLVMFGIEVAATTVVFTKGKDLKEAMKEEMIYSLEFSTNPEIEAQHRTGVTFMIDKIQQDFDCCGVNNYTDWYKVGTREKKVPVSCCVEPHDVCGDSQSYEWHNVGCMEEIEYWFIKHLYIIGVVGLSIAVIQILTMISSIMLFCSIGRDKGI